LAILRPKNLRRSSFWLLNADYFVRIAPENMKRLLNGKNLLGRRELIIILV
jgi:hypothetical protein